MDVRRKDSIEKYQGIERDLLGLYGKLKHCNFDKISFECLDFINNIKKFDQFKVHYYLSVIIILEHISSNDILFFDNIYDRISNYYIEGISDSVLFNVLRNEYLDKKRFVYNELLDIVNNFSIYNENIDKQKKYLEKIVENALELEMFNNNLPLGNMYTSGVIDKVVECYNLYKVDKENVRYYLGEIAYILKFEQGYDGNYETSNIFREAIKPEQGKIIQSKVQKISTLLKQKLNQYLQQFTHEVKNILKKKIEASRLSKSEIPSISLNEVSSTVPVAAGGRLILTDIDNDNDIDLLSIIVYTSLRVADTIHDFNGVGLNKNIREYLDDIKFYINKPFFSLSKSQGYSLTELYKKLVDQDSKLFGIFQLVYETEIKNVDSKRSSSLMETINLFDFDCSKHISNIEDYTIEVLSNLIKKVYFAPRLDDGIKKKLLTTFRPSKKIFYTLANELLKTSTPNCVAKIVNKEKIIEDNFMSFFKDITYDSNNEAFLEQVKFDGNNKSERNNNLLLLAVKKSEPIDKKSYNLIQQLFNQSNSINVSYDMGSITLELLSLIEKYEQTNGIKDRLFTIPNKVIAEIWDPADNKGATRSRYKNHNLQNIEVTRDLLDIDNKEEDRLITICKPNRNLRLEFFPPETVYGWLDGNNLNLGESKYGEIGKIVKKINSANKTACDGFYIKNSGDWGQVKSANNNKLILLSEDKLCNEYATLTNTTNLYGFKMAQYDNYNFFVIHKGELQKTVFDVFFDIHQIIKNNNYISEIIFECEDVNNDIIDYKMTTKSNINTDKLIIDSIKEIIQYRFNFILKEDYQMNTDKTIINPSTTIEPLKLFDHVSIHFNNIKTVIDDSIKIRIQENIPDSKKSLFLQSIIEEIQLEKIKKKISSETATNDFTIEKYNFVINKNNDIFINENKNLFLLYGLFFTGSLNQKYPKLPGIYDEFNNHLKQQATLKPNILPFNKLNYTYTNLLGKTQIDYSYVLETDDLEFEKRITLSLIVLYYTLLNYNDEEINYINDVFNLKLDKTMPLHGPDGIFKSNKKASLNSLEEWMNFELNYFEIPDKNTVLFDILKKNDFRKFPDFSDKTSKKIFEHIKSFYKLSFIVLNSIVEYNSYLYITINDKISIKKTDIITIGLENVNTLKLEIARTDRKGTMKDINIHQSKYKHQLNNLSKLHCNYNFNLLFKFDDLLNPPEFSEEYQVYINTSKDSDMIDIIMFLLNDKWELFKNPIELLQDYHLRKFKKIKTTDTGTKEIFSEKASLTEFRKKFTTEYSIYYGNYDLQLNLDTDSGTKGMDNIFKNNNKLYSNHEPIIFFDYNEYDAVVNSKKYMYIIGNLCNIIIKNSNLIHKKYLDGLLYFANQLKPIIDLLEFLQQNTCKQEEDLMNKKLKLYKTKNVYILLREITVEKINQISSIYLEDFLLKIKKIQIDEQQDIGIEDECLDDTLLKEILEIYQK